MTAQAFSPIGAAASAGAGPAAVRLWLWRLGGPACSAALFALAFPPSDLGALAWVALLPLLLAAHHLGARAGFMLGGAFGVFSSLAIYHWLLEVPAIGAPQMAVLAAYVSLYPALWCAALPLLRRGRLPLVLSAPALWVTLDALKANAGFLALPWATFAHSQHENLALLQLASLTGEAGVSFVVVMVNVALAQAIATRSATRSLAVTGALVAACHGAGALRLAAPESGPRVTLAAVQPALSLGARDTPAAREAAWQTLETLSLEAAARGAQLIVWPETVVRDPQRDAALAQRLAALARRVGVPLVLGAAESAKSSQAAPDGGLTVRDGLLHNAAYLVPPDGDIAEPYRKRRLVPFAEYTPLGFAWPAALVRPGLHLQAGDATAQWTLPGGLRIAPLICWENLFSGLSRETVRGGAQVLVQLTDDAWFGASAASRQHNLASVLRAVENGVPVVVASNAGPSMVIDVHGRVVATANAGFGAAVVTASVAAGAAAPPYTRGGEWFAVLCVLSILCACAPSNSRSKQ